MAINMSLTTKRSNRIVRPSEIPDWARDDIEAAIQKIDEEPWRDLTAEFMRPYCEQVCRTADLFNTYEVQARECLLVEIFEGASRVSGLSPWWQHGLQCCHLSYSG